MVTIVCSVTLLIALGHMRLAPLSAIQQALPLVVTLVAAIVYREEVGPFQIAAIALGFAGVLMIVRPGTSGFDGWAALAVVAMLTTAVRDLATRHLSPDVSSAGVAFWSTLGVALVTAAGRAFEPWRALTAAEAGILLVAAMVLASSYYFTIRALRQGEIALIAPFRYVGLVWAIGFGWAVFGTLPDPMTVIGASIVVATGLFTCWREVRAAGPGRWRRIHPPPVDNPRDSPYTPVTRAKAQGLND